MNLESVEVIRLAEAYVNALTGTDVLGALLIHATKAGVNLKYIPLDANDAAMISKVHKVFSAANGQNKIKELIAAAALDGIDLSSGALKLSEENKAIQLPRLQIEEHIPYISSGLPYDNLQSDLLTGYVTNSSIQPYQLFLQVYLQGYKDLVRVALNVPPEGIKIPRMRSPRLFPEEYSKIVNTVASATLVVELINSATNLLVDQKQLETWLLQADIVVLAQQLDNGVIKDFTSNLSWIVNSGARGIADFLARNLPSDIRQNLGYLYEYNTESIKWVDRQVEALYEVMRKQNFIYMPTESISVTTKEIIQRVKKPEVSLQEPSKYLNCLDGAVLFASLLEYMGLHPILIILPKHALVGWKRRPVVLNVYNPEMIRAECGFLDTTCLTADIDFLIASSAADGYFATNLPLFTKEPTSLAEFAKIIDVKNSRYGSPFQN